MSVISNGNVCFNVVFILISDACVGNFPNALVCCIYTNVDKMCDWVVIVDVWVDKTVSSAWFSGFLCEGLHCKPDPPTSLPPSLCSSTSASLPWTQWTLSPHHSLSPLSPHHSPATQGRAWHRGCLPKW
jgi:hypothetical protein